MDSSINRKKFEVVLHGMINHIAQLVYLNREDLCSDVITLDGSEITNMGGDHLHIELFSSVVYNACT